MTYQGVVLNSGVVKVVNHFFGITCSIYMHEVGWYSYFKGWLTM